MKKLYRARIQKKSWSELGKKEKNKKNKWRKLLKRGELVLVTLQQVLQQGCKYLYLYLYPSMVVNIVLDR